MVAVGDERHAGGIDTEDAPGKILHKAIRPSALAKLIIGPSRHAAADSQIGPWSKQVLPDGILGVPGLIVGMRWIIWGINSPEGISNPTGLSRLPWSEHRDAA
jgi:hypothetical protein